MRQALQRFLAGRSARERWALAAAALLLAAAVLYAGVWEPMTGERARLLAELPRLRAELRELRADAQELARLRAAAKPATPDLAAALAEAARKRFAQAEPELSAGPGGAVQVSFRRVRADQWFAWVGALHAERGIRIESALLESTGEPGMVRVRAMLTVNGVR